MGDILQCTLTFQHVVKTVLGGHLWDKEKVEVKKFDPVVRQHVMYKEAKIK